MFKQEKVIPAVAILIFAFGVFGLVWGDPQGIAGSLPPLVALGMLFLMNVLWMSIAGLSTARRKSRGWLDRTAMILGAAGLALLVYASNVPRSIGGQQISFSCLCGGFLFLLCLLFVMLDVLRRRREEEAAGKPADTDIKV